MSVLSKKTTCSAGVSCACSYLLHSEWVPLQAGQRTGGIGRPCAAARPRPCLARRPKPGYIKVGLTARVGGDGRQRKAAWADGLLARAAWPLPGAEPPTGTSATRAARPRSAGWSCDLGVLNTVQYMLERDSNPRQTNYKFVALPLSYPMVPLRESNPAALRPAPAQGVSAGRVVRHTRRPTVFTGRRAPAGRTLRRQPLACERSTCAADAWARPAMAGRALVVAPEASQFRRECLGSRAASQSCTSARIWRPSSRKLSNRLGT